MKTVLENSLVSLSRRHIEISIPARYDIYETGMT